MTRDEFWSLIDTARREATREDDDDDGDDDGDLALLDAASDWLVSHLSTRSPEEITSFETHLAALLEASYTWRLWGAAYVINGGCSDDGFDYFRGWLVMQGRAVFDAALADPDSLAAHVPDGGDVEHEDTLYVSMRAYEAVTGNEGPDVSVHLRDLGDSWDFDDAAEMKARYPRLWAKFGWG